MDPDSTAITSDCLSISSNNCANEDDYISRILGFDDNSSTEVGHSSDVSRIMPKDPMKTSNDPVPPEHTSEFKAMNGHSHISNNESFDEIDEDFHPTFIENGFNLTQKLKELMQIKKEANDLREKYEQAEKEKNELQSNVKLLAAENKQFQHLKNDTEESNQKINELRKDLASKSKAQLKLRSEIENCNSLIFEKNDAIRKMKRDNKSLWNMVTRFARKLKSADLLTVKEKNIMKKYGEENLILVDTFDSEDQGEEKGHSSLISVNEMSAEASQNSESVGNENVTANSDNLPIHCMESDSKKPKVKSEGFQFSQSNTSLPKLKFSSGANYFMKSCRDVIEDPHVSDDCLDVTVNELKEMRRQLSVPKDHFSPISPLPPTPPPSSNRFRHGLSRNLTKDNPILAVPVCKSPGQISKVSKNEGLPSVNSSVPNSSRRLTFCHQQSEGFDAPPEHSAPRFRSDAGNPNLDGANASSHANSPLVPYRFSSKRCQDGTFKFTFHIQNPISLDVDPNTWEVSCILGQRDIETTVPSIDQPQAQTENVQLNEPFSNNSVCFENNEPVRKKRIKVEPVSPIELTTPVLKSSDQSRFVSVEKSNVSELNISNHDISMNTNSSDNFSKETAFQKELLFHHPHGSGNDSKALVTFVNMHTNETNQHSENHVDDNRSVVSSSCESPSPYKKKNEFLSPSHNLASTVSDVKPKKLDNLSNVSKACSVPEVNCQLEYDSTGSESEFTDKGKLTKTNMAKSGPVKRRRKSSLMAVVETSYIVPARNKGRTLLSRSIASSKNTVNANTNLEEEKISESNNDENKTSISVQFNEKCFSEKHDKLEKQNKFDSKNSDPSNHLKSPKNIVEENEKTDDPKQQVETFYENVSSKKRISRVKTKKCNIAFVDHPTKVKSKKSKSPKKKSKKKQKEKLERKAALKNRAEKRAARRMKDGDEGKELVLEQPPNTEFRPSNAEIDYFEKHDAEKLDVVQTETEVQKKFLDHSEEMENVLNDSFDTPVESCDKIKSKDISVKINNDILSNAPSIDHTIHSKMDENLEIVSEISNNDIPNSTACFISKNDIFEELFNTSEIDNCTNNNESVVALNQDDKSASIEFSNQTTVQKMNNNIADVDNLFKNVESAKMQSSVLNEASSLVETNNSPTNLLCVSPIQEKTSSLKTDSPSKSPAEIKSSGFRSFPSKNNSEVNAEFPELTLPPLPLNPFGLSDNKFHIFSHKMTNIDKKTVESPVFTIPDKNAKLSISNKNSLCKLTSLSENKNSTEIVNSVETSHPSLFNQREFTDENFIDFLVQDEEDSSVKATVSETATSQKVSSNTTATTDNFSKVGVTEMEESQTSSHALSDGIAHSTTSSSFEPEFDTVINDVAVDGISTEMMEPKESSQTVSDITVPSSASSFETVPNVFSNVDMIIDSVAVGGVEIEVETQDPSSRTCRKRQVSTEDCTNQAEKKKVKGSLKSIDLSIAKESALTSDDTKEISNQLSDADSDVETPLVIAEEFEEIHRPIPEVSDLEVSPVDSASKHVPNKTKANKKQNNYAKTPKKMDTKIEVTSVKAAFQSIDKIKFSENHFRLHVHTLVTVLINPSVSESAPKLVYHLVNYLHTTRKNPMMSFFISKDQDTLLSTSEQCILKALLIINAKNKPHLDGLLPYAVDSIYQLVLGKMQYQIYGLGSLCRLMAAICKELNDPSKPRQLCCDVLKYNHKFAPFLIASIVSVYKEAFEVRPETTEEEKIFLSALSYGVQQKPKTMTEAQWKHSNNVFSKYLTVEVLANVSETVPYLMSEIEDKCLFDTYENEYMLTGPLVIYARVKGWEWAQEHLLEDYILPQLKTYSEEEDGERAFSFFTDLCADICYSCPDEELSRSFLKEFWRNPGDREFVQVHAMAASMKLILLRRELFPDDIQAWIPHFHEDPRIESTGVYFRRRIMEDEELQFDGNFLF